MTNERATAFVPGHVTAFFSAHPADEPAAAGSRGAGLTLTDGVEVTVTEGDSLTVDGDDVEVEPVERVLDTLDVEAAVDVETDLPIGAGFGVSGAAALGTALAANQTFDCGHSENDLIQIAHVAEVEAGTGLGDVVAQAHGGIPIRLEPGAPGYGRIDAVPASTRVEYVSFGELSTVDVLAGDTSGLTAAGERALTTLERNPRLPTLVAAAQEFTKDAGLLVPEVAEAIDAVEDAGGDASMAMLGRTVFALGTGLSDAGYDPAVCRTHPAGMQLLADE
ncbi:MAG: pantoate kinase [Halopenitus sp.]